MIPGLYLRDISDTRLGAEAYDFRHHNEPPEHEEYCLSLIGTEGVLSLQLPTQVTISLSSFLSFYLTFFLLFSFFFSSF